MAVTTTVGVAVEDAFLIAYERAHERTVRLAHVLCGDMGVAEEVAHDAWVGAYRAHQRSPLREIEPYVCRSVVHALRSRARRRVTELAFLRVAASSVRLTAGADGEVVDRLALLPVLQQLPERMRTCVVLRFYVDLSVGETAQTMGVSEGTVKSTTAKALARLRELWGEEE